MLARLSVVSDLLQAVRQVEVCIRVRRGGSQRRLKRNGSRADVALLFLNVSQVVPGYGHARIVFDCRSEARHRIVRLADRALHTRVQCIDDAGWVEASERHRRCISWGGT